MKGAARDIDKAGDAAKKSRKEFNGFFKDIKTGLRQGIGLLAAWAGAQGIGQIVDRSKQLAPVTAAFESLGKTIEAQASTFLPMLQKAARGMVNDFELMRQANNAMTLGVATSSEQYSELVQNAIRLGKALGIDAKNAIESITVGIGRQSKLWLDNLGIIVDTEKAYADFAASIGKTVKQLTDAERKAAFSQAAMQGLQEAVSKLGPETEAAGEAIARAQTTLQNLTDEFLQSEGFNNAVRIGTGALQLLADNIQLVIEAVAAFIAVQFTQKMWATVEALKAGEGAAKGFGAALKSIGPVLAIFAGIEIIKVLNEQARVFKLTGDALKDHYKKQLEDAIPALKNLTEATREETKKQIAIVKTGITAQIESQLQYLQTLARIERQNQNSGNSLVDVGQTMRAEMSALQKQISDLRIRFKATTEVFDDAIKSLEGSGKAAEKAAGSSGSSSKTGVSGGSGFGAFGTTLYFVSNAVEALLNNFTVEKFEPLRHVQKWVDESAKTWLNLGQDAVDTGNLIEETIETLENTELPEVLSDSAEQWIEALQRVSQEFNKHFSSNSEIAQALSWFASALKTTYENMEDKTRGLTGALSDLWRDHWDQVVSYGLSALSQLFGGKQSKVGSAFSGASSGAAIGSVFGPWGAAIGGGLGFLGGLFGGGGSDSAARNAERLRQWQEQTNKLLEDFVSSLKDLVATDIFEWTDDLQEMFIRLRSRGADLTGAFDLVADSMERTQMDIEDLITGLGEMPDVIKGIRFEIDDARRTRYEARRSFAEANQNLWQYVLDNYGTSLGLYDKLQGARGKDSKLGGYISFQEERQILKDINDPQLKELIRQTIAAENAVFLAEEQVKELQERRKDALKEFNVMKENLPKMKRHLEKLRELQEQLGADYSQHFNRNHDDLVRIEQAVRDGNGGIVAANGADFIASGPMSGYPVNFIGHGTERFTVTPQNKIGQGVVNNYSLHFYTENPASLKAWLNSGGANEIRRAVESAQKFGGGRGPIE